MTQNLKRGLETRQSIRSLSRRISGFNYFVDTEMTNVTVRCQTSSKKPCTINIDQRQIEKDSDNSKLILKKYKLLSKRQLQGLIKQRE